MANWKLKIDLKDVFHNEEMSFEDKRDVIVRRIRQSGWHAYAKGPLALKLAVDYLAEAADVDEFDTMWNYIYDVADDDLVWIETF